MRTAFFFATLTLAGAAHAQSLSVDGACPGAADITGSGFTPGGSVAVLTGSGPGSDAMPGGPCAGGVTDMTGLRYITTLRADGGGSLAARPSISGALCGDSVQFLDVTTCSLSNREIFGDAPGPVNTVVWDGYLYASIDDVPPEADYGTWENNCTTEPYPVPPGWELAPYVAGLETMINLYDWSTHCMVTADGFTWRCNNYGPPGDCIGGGFLEGDDVVGYSSPACSLRPLIRTRL